MNENPIDAVEQYELGLYYITKYDDKKAEYWIKKAAEQGYGEAQNELGSCYLNGALVLKDLEKAVYWYTKAAEQGHAGGQYNLGLCYGKGNGVQRDLEKAVYWVTKSAEQGDEDAKKILAQLA